MGSTAANEGGKKTVLNKNNEITTKQLILKKEFSDLFLVYVIAVVGSQKLFSYTISKRIKLTLNQYFSIR